MTKPAAEIRLDRLLHTACDVIAQRGLANTRTVDVARAAGVSQSLVFYHFATKDRLVAHAYAYAAGQELARLDGIRCSPAPPIDRLRRLLKAYAPGGRARSWPLWIHGWAAALDAPELVEIGRGLEEARHQTLTEVISDGVRSSAFTERGVDPSAAAWRLGALIDGLALRSTLYPRMVSRRQVGDLIREATAREVGLDPAELT